MHLQQLDLLVRQFPPAPSWTAEQKQHPKAPLPKAFPPYCKGNPRYGEHINQHHGISPGIFSYGPSWAANNQPYLFSCSQDSFVPPPDMPPPPGTPPPLDVFKLVLRFEGADYMSITGNPDLYMKFVSDLKARTALAMKVCVWM